MCYNAELTYLHGDALGSTVLTTEGGGTAQQRYYAYGRTRSGGNLPTDRTYTGQQQDRTGLLYYNVRYYDPRGPIGRGRFISPDTLVPDPSNLQDYNRFAYAHSELVIIGHANNYAATVGLAVASECHACSFRTYHRPESELRLPLECWDGSDILLIEELGLVLMTDLAR